MNKSDALSSYMAEMVDIMQEMAAKMQRVKEIKADRVKHWMSHGAQLSDTVHNWLIDKKLIPGKKINTLPLKKPIAKAVAKDATATPAAAPAPVEAPKA